MEEQRVSERLYVIAGMSRGGTNLLWNVVQSHPAVIDSYFELNEIFGRKTAIGFADKVKVELEALCGIRQAAVRQLIVERLAHFARKSFDEDTFNREKRPGVRYQSGEFPSLTVCTKLVSSWETDPLRKVLRRNDALKYLPLLERTFGEVRTVFLVRNGLAVAEGWRRRGAPIIDAAHWYRRYVLRYEAYVAQHPGKAMIVRFEDLLADPFEVAGRVYRALDLDGPPPETLRIAIKPTIRANRDVVNTTQKTKLWVTRQNWREHIDATINDAQIAAMSAGDCERFVEINRDLMARYGYVR